MKVLVDLAGTGVGAQRQYELLREARPSLFVGSEGVATHIIYWQSFTRDWEKLERRRRAGKKIVARVGGFHLENAETTWRLLKVADGAIFVAEWLKEYLKTKRLLGKTWRLPPHRAVIRNGSTWLGRRESDVPYLLIRNAQIGSVGFKRGLNRAYSVWAIAQIWDQIRSRYPNLELWLLGDHDRRTKAKYAFPGWKWLGFKESPRWYGQGAIALIHLVAGDFSPNTVCEALGEGIPVIVPNVGGAAEVAGYGGRQVRFMHTDTRSFPSAECGGKFYQVDLDSLFDAVCDVMENRQHWWLAVRDWWRHYVDISGVAKRYERFLVSIR